MRKIEHKVSIWFYIVTVLSMAWYVGYYGWFYSQGKPKFHDQKLLLMEVGAGILIATLPFVMEKLGGFYFPEVELVFFYIFLYLSIFLGSGMQFYSVPYWDKYEHLFSAVMLAGLGFGIFNVLGAGRQKARTEPLLMSFFAFTFGTTLGVFWEFYEFTMDGLANLNLQRYMEAGHMLVGRAALMDTMGDLIADVSGSLLMALIGYIIMKIDPSKISALVFKSKKISIFSNL
ncbi:hypothetical protein [Lentilactobacillus senioris]|uniref:hypothetical protein n=1 Tax=Lentilactobacillus senioris TaxID=931534 RepID=UPI003D2A3565